MSAWGHDMSVVLERLPERIAMAQHNIRNIPVKPIHPSVSQVAVQAHHLFIQAGSYVPKRSKGCPLS